MEKKMGIGVDIEYNENGYISLKYYFVGGKEVK